MGSEHEHAGAEQAGTARRTADPVAATSLPAAAQLVAAGRAGAQPAAVLALQRAAGNAAVTRLASRRVLAREPTAPAAPAPLVGYFDFEVETYEQLAANFRYGASLIRDELKGVNPESDLAKRASEYAREIADWADYYNQSGDRRLHAEALDLLRLHLSDMRKQVADYQRDIEWVKDAPKRAKLREAAEEARRVAAEAQKLAPKLADSARAAFKSGDTDLLATVAGHAGTMLDIGLGIQELSRQIAEKAAATQGVSLSAISKYTEALGKLNKGLAALNLALSLTGDKGKTELDEGVRQIGIAAGAFSALGTLASLPAHMGLYANLYLVPLTQACLAGVARIGEYTHERNKTWTELFGSPGNFFVEPGGKPMWNYMVAVMNAGKPSGVPDVPAAVEEYFMDHRSAFDAGAGGRGIPTTGLVFKDLDKSRFKDWVWANRKAVWAMLYGSMKVGKAA